MKVVVYTKYGPPNVVALAEVPKPAPKVHEVLIRIHATTVDDRGLAGVKPRNASRVRAPRSSRLRRLWSTESRSSERSWPEKSRLSAKR